MYNFRVRLLVFSILFVLPILACNAVGGGEPAVADSTSPPTVRDTSTDPVTTTDVTEEAVVPVQEGPLPVTDLEGVQQAIVQVIAQGSFVDPQVGQVLNAAGSGSGFIIDPSGIAVTNNHVVTGAALLQVYVGGSDQPRNARVLGVSECSDLAVIDIDGEGYPYLRWYDGNISVGLDVYAAGFPLGDPEFTLTRGIISKANAFGDTSWASIDSVLEHDATINPGNSGGPLITVNGQVVGVNYAGRSDTNQYYAISRDEALRHIEQLRQGSDVTSIGINGTAVADPEQGLYGIWVASVKSGSPADRAGVVGGDIVTRLENLVLATDGTMSDYCDILRSRAPGDVMRVEVLRFATQEVLEGQLNGNPLEVTFNFAQELAGEVSGSDPATGGSATGYPSYTTVTDNSGQLSVEIPTAWGDVDGSPWTADDGSVLGPAIAAAPNLDNYYSSWQTPGMEFAAFFDVSITEPELLDLFDFSGDCSYGGRFDYADPLYTGQYDLWENCGGVGTLYIVLASVPQDRSFISVVAIQVVTEADLEALDTILNSYVVSQ